MKELILNRVLYWDVASFTFIFGLNGRRFLSLFVLWLSRSADGYLYPLIGLLVLIVAPLHSTEFIIAGLSAFTIELTIYKAVKNSIKRTRPYKSLDGIHHGTVPIDQFSFPSGHTAAAFVMATLLSYFYPFLTPLVYLWACLVGFSRIYLGVHYPTDTLAGMVLGLLSALSGIALVV